jgi:hypothetical protein
VVLAISFVATAVWFLVAAAIFTAIVVAARAFLLRATEPEWPDGGPPRDPSDRPSSPT